MGRRTPHAAFERVRNLNARVKGHCPQPAQYSATFFAPEMSSEIVKKRGRSRKALASDEGVIVLDQAEIEKTKKAATKKRAAKNIQDSTQAKAEDISSQPSSAISDKETISARSKN